MKSEKYFSLSDFSCRQIFRAFFENDPAEI